MQFNNQQFYYNWHNIQIIIIEHMPRLKKYSEIHDENTTTNFDFQKGQYIPKQKQPKQQEDKQSGQSQSSQSSASLSHKQQSQTGSNARFTPLHRKSENENAKKSRSIPRQQKGTYKKSNKKYDADQILKKMQQQCAEKQEDQESKRQDDQTNADIPDDVLVGFEEKKKRNKKDKSALKIKNKFFNFEVCENNQGQQVQNQQSNQVNQDIEQLRKLQQQHKQILAMKNSRNDALMNQRKSQIQNKVTRLRQRLQFKNGHEDIRFKEHMKQALDNVKDCDQVEIMIEAPKIFRGASARQTDAALLIKNMGKNLQRYDTLAEQSIQKSVHQKQETNNKKIDRKQFYQEFTKHVKQIKAIDLPAQTNQIFKKSSLDDLQEELNKNEHLFKQQTCSRRSLTHLQRSISQSRNSRKSVDSQKQSDSKSNSRSKMLKSTSFRSGQKRQEIVNKIQVVQEDQSNQQSIATNLKHKENNSIINANKYVQSQPTINNKSIQLVESNAANFNKSVKKTQEQNISQIDIKKAESKPQIKNEQNNDKRKSNKKKNRDKIKNKNRSKSKNKKESQAFRKKIKGLFDQQAEDSQNGYGDDGHSSQSGDSDSVESLIDRKQVKHILKNERNAKKKFIDDEINRDKQILRRIKQRILMPKKIKCEDNNSSARRRRKRIDDERRKYEQEDRATQAQQCQNGENQNKNYPEKNESDDNNQFFKKLRDLQEEICVKKQRNENSNVSKAPIALDRSRKVVRNQIKIINKGQIEAQPKHQAVRGGFLKNPKAVTGSKIQEPKKSKSKPKNISF